MTERKRKAPSIDTEWASSLIGLRLNVPANWWDGYNGRKLHPGQIVAVDPENTGGKYFMFELDEEKDAHYPMRYDALVKYVDRTQGGIGGYDLPDKIRKAKKPKAAFESHEAVELDRDEAVIKQEASKLKKIISGNGIDVVADLKKRLDSGDYETVKLLKTMYPSDKVKTCLLCKKKVCIGSTKKCKLAHDVEWFDFDKDDWRSDYGTHYGSCSRCGESVSEDGHEEDFNPGNSLRGVCYKGKHVFSEKDKQKVMDVLERKRLDNEDD
eukprot:scaffold90174_cov65-Cyclotella_meneghiniana.AAC.2